MAVIIQAKAGVTLLFGIGTGIAALSGYIINSDDQEQSSKTSEALDSQGSTVAKAYYDQMIDIKFEALLISGTTLPTPGSDVTISSVKYIAEKIVQKEVNTKFTMVTIDLKRYIDNAIPN
jgi:hypothetical protein